MANARNAKSAREKAAQMRAEAARAQARQRALIAGVVVLALVIIGGLAAWKGPDLFKSAKATSDANSGKSVPTNFGPNGYVWQADASTPSGSASVSASPSASVSPVAKKVTVDVYEDFQCPICKEFEAAGGPILTQYATQGKIELRYHPVAILDRASSTEYSTRSTNAWAAVLSTSPSSVQKFHDLLFANQPAEGSAGLSDGQLLDLAVQAGANRTALEPLVTNRSYGDWVAKQTDQFSKDGFTGTPTIVVNGQKQENNDPTAIKAAIDKALAG